MFTGNPVTFNPYGQSNPFPSPLSFMGPLTNQVANPFAQPQAVNPWLVLAWLNQFNPYAGAFPPVALQQNAAPQGFSQPGFSQPTTSQPGFPQQFSWQAFWNANPTNAPTPAAQPGTWNPGFGQTIAPNFTPFSSSQGIFGTSNFHSNASGQQTGGANNVPSYPSFPGVPSYFTQSQPVTNPLDEHTPPKRTARNGV